MFRRRCFFGAGMLLLIQALAVMAADEPMGYYRYPTAYGNNVVFTADGDLWMAPLSGETARRLTSAAGEEKFAMFSPDGKWIAFSGNYDGNVDVYVISADGGVPKRLTYQPGADWVAAWSPKGDIVFRTYTQNGRFSYQCFSVSPNGGYPEILPIDEAAHISFEPNGDRIAYTRVSLGGRTWKRYKGGWAEDIMVGSTKTHDYKKVTNNDGNDATPMWFGDRIYYVRDNDARANLHSMKPDGSDIKQLTFHTDWDIRWPSLADGKIAYSAGADIWVYDIASGKESKIDIALPSEQLQARDKFISPDEYNDEYALSPDGGRLLLSARGELFTAPTAKRGLIYQVSNSPGARERAPQYAAKGDSVLAWSDLTGEEVLYLYPAKGGDPRKLASGAGGYNFPVAVSPDSKWGVYGDNNRKLNLVDMKSGTTTQIDTACWEMGTYRWSPDSRYIAYDANVPNEHAQVRIYDTKEKKVHAVTDEMWSSYSPTWDPNGKWLYFISSRYMNSYNGTNDWSFITLNADEILAVALTKDTRSPYAYTEDDADKKDDDDKKDKDKDKDKGKDKKKDDKDDKEDKDEEKPVEVKIDWDGLSDRVITLPVDAGNYGALRAIEDKLYFLSYRNTGWRGEDDEDENPRNTLHLFDIKAKKDHEVVKGANGYTLSGDLKKIAVRKKDDFVIMDAGEKEEPEKDEDADPDEGLHLDEWTYDADPRAEWKQIYREAWRMQKNFFYDPNMHGVNWQAQGDHYAELLDRLMNRDELNDLIGQLFGELTSGHAYVGGGDNQKSKSVGVGLLGVDASRDNSGFFRIDSILAGDHWDEDRSGPLTAPGIDAKKGDFLVAIDRKPTNSVQNYLELLVNKADKLVLVSLNDKPSLDGARDYVVKAIASEYELRYWDWVTNRMKYVKDHGGDDIGYVHLSDMGSAGLEQWMREYYPQSGKKSLIMDVRYNGGGNIAVWILSELDRKVWNWGIARNGYEDRGPGTAFYGHMIALCNEETGSDGETFSEGWKRLKLGPLVGKRTWGGWVGIRGDKPFLDKGNSTEPEFTGWGIDSKWLIEGPGVYPDTEIDNHPKQMMEGIDEQLDYAIDYLKKQMKDNPMNRPPRPPFPIKAATGYKK